MQFSTKVLLISILALGAFFRFYQLGYSHFYGDETKAMYYRKKVPAIEHFFNQRKGPGQFVIAWGVENITDSFDETFMRLPFATASILSIYILYLVVKKYFDEKVALLAAFLFSINGFYIAFGRTVQYQSFYILFGLLSLYFYLYAQGKIKHYLLSGISMGLAFLFHYDSIFFLVPLLATILCNLKFKKVEVSKLKYFVIPLVLIPALFYIPYIIFGSFRTDTLPYLLLRRSGGASRPSSILYTYSIYNPFYVLLIFNIFSLYSLKFLKYKSVKILYVWFLVPFFLFTLVFKSVGTHVHNFLLPLIILSSFGFIKLTENVNKIFLKVLFVLTFICLLFVVLVQLQVYIPKFNTGYPWKNSTIAGFDLKKVDQSKELYAYGFPYYRRWEMIAKELDFEDEGRFYYSNDNDTVSEFYMRKFKLYDGRATQNYIHIYNSQMGESRPIDIRYLDTTAYIVLKDFYVGEEKVATIFHRLSVNRH